jgi:hypothetical protein
MPLVVPGLMSNDSSNSSGDDWMNKLAGKKIGEQHDEMVPSPPVHLHHSHTPYFILEHEAD